MRLESHTLAKISPSWSLAAIHCRRRVRDQESQSGVENPFLRLPGSTTQNSCVSTGIWNVMTVTVQKWFEYQIN
ncbi:hypothetical protein ACVWYH_001456 [Bradyrhizobium sp. GM24.11]